MNVKAVNLVMSHAIAVDVIARTHAQHLGKTLVEAYPVVNLGRRGDATFETSVDDIDSHAEAWDTSGTCISAGGRPATADEIVARRLRRLGSHPEPQGSLEGDRTIRLHQVRVGEQIDTQSLTRRAVVVVPR